METETASSEKASLKERIFSRLFGSQGGGFRSTMQEDLIRSCFSDYLNLMAYSVEEERYYNSDGSTGWLLELSPLCFASDRIAETLEGLFRQGLPKGTILQFVLYADPNISRILESYKKTKTRDSEVLQRSIASYIEFLEEGKDGMPQNQGIPCRNFRVFLSIKLPVVVEEELDVMQLRSLLLEVLLGASLSPQLLAPQSLLRILRELFNGEGTDSKNDVYDEQVPISKQIIDASTKVTHSYDHLRIGKRYFAAVTPKAYPKELSCLTMNQVFGGIRGVVDDATQITVPFWFSLCIVVQDMAPAIHKKCNLVLSQKFAGSFAPALLKKQQEYLWAVQQIEDRQLFVRVIPCLWLFHEAKSRVDDAVSRSKRVFEDAGFYMQKDCGILQPLWLSSLFFGQFFTASTLQSLQRDFITSSLAACHSVPVQADFSGNGSSELLFVGRKGQLISLDLFSEHSTNKNCYIAAGSGGGKSFLVNYLVGNYYASGSLIRLVDVGGSYEKLCRMWGGKYLDFDASRKICINPFSRVIADQGEDQRNESLAQVAATLSMMVYSSSKTRMQETESSLIKEAVSYAYEQEGEEASVDLVCEFLNTYSAEDNKVSTTIAKSLQSLAASMAYNLSSFKKDGMYGRFFNGKSTLDMSQDPFVVLEMNKITAQKELCSIITLQLIHEMTYDLYQSDRSQRRFILFDEAWQFLGGGEKMIEDSIERGYRTARKYGGSFTIITQSIMDLENFGTVGNVIRSNSSYKFYLKSDDFQKALEKKLIDYSPFIMKLLESVKTNKPKYSEIFMDTETTQGIARLIIDPYSYFLYTSDAAENAAMDVLRENGLSDHEAILAMVQARKA